jgi:putative ABC transport system permease protein
MWRVGLLDLLHRRRRFVLAVIATSLAFGLSLLMAGTIAHIQNETDRIIALFGADRFVVADGGTGPSPRPGCSPKRWCRRCAARRA